MNTKIKQKHCGINKNFKILLLIFGGILLWYVQAIGGTYKNSAHGNSNFGVKRDSTNMYATGHCSHCHTQHASLNGITPSSGSASKFCLMADNFNDSAITGFYTQQDNVCFSCHCNTVSSLQETSLNNYNYSHTFGGETAITPDSIMDAFNRKSRHDLNEILDFVTDKWSSTFTKDSNPCSACHNVHITQRSCGKPSSSDSLDPSKSAISKPSEHAKLWGVPDTERMSAYTTYIAPFYVDANPDNPSTKHEPDGGNYIKTGANGDNMPNYITFCLDCHNSDMTDLKNDPIAWSDIGYWNQGEADQHGRINGAGSSNGDLKAPYTSDGTSNGAQVDSTNFVLSCTDCHEPHGSSNEYLIRTTVNGTDVSITESGQWSDFCSACHTYTSHNPQGVACNICHHHGLNF